MNEYWGRERTDVDRTRIDGHLFAVGRGRWCWRYRVIDRTIFSALFLLTHSNITLASVILVVYVRGVVNFNSFFVSVV